MVPFIVYGLYTRSSAGEKRYFYVGKTERDIGIRLAFRSRLDAGRLLGTVCLCHARDKRDDDSTGRLLMRRASAGVVRSSRAG